MDMSGLKDAFVDVLKARTYNGRGRPRARVFVTATLSAGAGRYCVSVINVSQSGVLLHCPDAVEAFSEGRLVMGDLRHDIVSAGKRGDFLSLRFFVPLEVREFRAIVRLSSKQQRRAFGKRAA